ncbi:MAG: DedA family protein [Marmoricola sp.]
MLNSLLDGLVSLPPWLLLTLVFLLPALEASLFLGLVFPGETIVVLGGVSAHAGHVSLTAVVLLAVAGAIIGDQVGFHVGRRYGPGLVSRIPEQTRRAKQVEAALGFVRRRGATAVALGRWTASLRSVVPGVAGLSGMDSRRFTIANAAGGTVWAVAVAVAGFLAGASYKRLEAKFGLVGDVLLAAVVLFGIGWWGWRWYQRRTAPAE